METQRRSLETYIHLELCYCQQLNMNKAFTSSGKEGKQKGVSTALI